jgi:hypothetical protein
MKIKLWVPVALGVVLAAACFPYGVGQGSDSYSITVTGNEGESVRVRTTGMDGDNDFTVKLPFEKSFTADDSFEMQFQNSEHVSQLRCVLTKNGDIYQDNAASSNYGVSCGA